jgi:hypothetical protein
LKQLVFVFSLFVIILIWSQSLIQFDSTRQQNNSLPTLIYLGEGVNTYRNEPGWNFIVKRNNPYRLVFVLGPTYTSKATERVWRSQGTNGAPPAVYHKDTVVGPVTTGCLVRYVAIDDDIDGRFNSFLLNNTIIHTIDEGMVSQGEFIIPFDGTLDYDANDSIGMYLDVCTIVINETQTPNPLETPTSTSTATPTTSPLETPTSTSTTTPTINPLDTPTSTPTATPTINPLETPTSTSTATLTINPLETITVIPAFTPNAGQTATPITPVVSTPNVANTPTPITTVRPPREKACLRINFEVSGGVAKQGRFDVVETGGRLLFSWDAQDGWQDSGWIHEIDISFPSVYVQVFFYNNSSGSPYSMKILNPAPGTNYGWLSDGICHAIEVGWP